jgi:hypothetical protein
MPERMSRTLIMIRGSLRRDMVAAADLEVARSVVANAANEPRAVTTERRVGLHLRVSRLLAQRSRHLGAFEFRQQGPSLPVG